MEMYQETPDYKNELLPCPFCKGKAFFVRKGTIKVSMIVMCEDCGCQVESGDVDGFTLPERYRWNVRQ